MAGNSGLSNHQWVGAPSGLYCLSWGVEQSPLLISDLSSIECSCHQPCPQGAATALNDAVPFSEHRWWLPEAMSSRPLQGHHLLVSRNTHPGMLTFPGPSPLCCLPGQLKTFVRNLGKLWLSKGPVQWAFCCLRCLGLSEEGVEMRVPSAVPLQECLHRL